MHENKEASTELTARQFQLRGLMFRGRDKLQSACQHSQGSTSSFIGDLVFSHHLYNVSKGPIQTGT